MNELEEIIRKTHVEDVPKLTNNRKAITGGCPLDLGIDERPYIVIVILLGISETEEVALY
jgi:hypothetical protein